MKRALFVGLGGIGQRHLRNLRAVLGDAVEVCAYRTRRLAHVITPTLQVETDKDVEREYGVRATTSLEEALSWQPDAAFICNPSSLHVPVALQAARAGCHLFIEKPVSHSLEGLDALEAELARHGRTALVGYQLHFHPLLRRVRELLDAGTLGRVLVARAEVGEYMPNFHRYEDYRQMYASRRELGGGVLLAQIHETDLLCSWFGLPQRVFAMGGHLSSLEIDVEDVATVSLEWQTPEGKRVGSLHADYLQRPTSRGLVLIGERGKLAVDLVALSLRRWHEDGTLVEELALRDFDRNSMFIALMQHFVGCTQGREQPVVSLRAGAESLQVALAALASIDRGEAVRVLPRPASAAPSRETQP